MCLTNEQHTSLRRMLSWESAHHAGALLEAKKMGWDGLGGKHRKNENVSRYDERVRRTMRLKGT